MVNNRDDFQNFNFHASFTVTNVYLKFIITFDRDKAFHSQE